jgi:hypothetical protein
LTARPLRCRGRRRATSHSQGWYPALTLEHAKRNIIFHYKIDPVCGILTYQEQENHKLSEIHDRICTSYVIGPSEARAPRGRQ